MIKCDDYPEFAIFSKPTAYSHSAHLLKESTSRAYDLFLGSSVIAQDIHQNQVKSIFENLKQKWIKETMLFSNPNDIYNNHAYQTIIGLGNDVIPLLIDDMKNTGNHWFYALSQITGENPVQDKNKGDIKAMIKDWVNLLG